MYYEDIIDICYWQSHIGQVISKIFFFFLI